MMTSVDDRNRSLLAVAVESGSKDAFNAALAALGARLSADEVIPQCELA